MPAASPLRRSMSGSFRCGRRGEVPRRRVTVVHRVPLLIEADHDALHVGDLDLLGASDHAVMTAADTTGSVLVSADTDFGELLALSGRPGPSVVIFRRAPHRPERQAQLLLRALPDIENELARGARRTPPGVPGANQRVLCT